MDVPAEQLRATFRERASQYTVAEARLVLVREGATFRFVRGILRFTRGPQVEGETRDYGPLVLARRFISPEHAIEFASQLPAGKPASLSDISFEFPGECRISGPLGVPYREWPIPVGYFRLYDWPATIFAVGTSATLLNIPSGPLVRPALPLVVDGNYAASEWTGINPRRSLSDLNNALGVILPDYRARIRRVQIGETRVEVESEVNMEDLKVDLRAMVEGYEVYHEVATARDGSRFTFEIDRTSRIIYGFLVEQRQGTVLDWALLNLMSQSVVPEVEFSSPAQHIARLLDEGENEEVEFKEVLGDGRTLIQSVVAFANTKGGTILVGVSDDARLVGTKPQEDQRRIAEWMETRLDPPVGVSFETMRLDEKEVLVVRVSKGTNPPYQQRDNGVVYVRRGSTDRPARRPELDEFYRSRHGPTFPGWR